MITFSKIVTHFYIPKTSNCFWKNCLNCVVDITYLWRFFSVDVLSIVFYKMFYLLNVLSIILLSIKCPFMKWPLIWGHVRPHTKCGPNRFSRFDVYWIQTPIFTLQRELGTWTKSLFLLKESLLEIKLIIKEDLNLLFNSNLIPGFN